MSMPTVPGLTAPGLMFHPAGSTHLREATGASSVGYRVGVVVRSKECGQVLNERFPFSNVFVSSN